MKFTVTPLGGARSDVGRVVDGIVRYLQPKTTGKAVPDHPTPAGTEGPSLYFADGGEEPGRWLGRAAELADLHGDVQRNDFVAVLSGRDPHTGERLISAQGSAGRRGHLGAGNATRTGSDGTLLYDETDAAAVLGITKAEAARMIDVGAAIAADAADAAPGEGRANGHVQGRVSGRAEGRVSSFTQVRASYLVPVTDGDGSRFVTKPSCRPARPLGRPVSIPPISAPRVLSMTSCRSARPHASLGSRPATSEPWPNVTRNTLSRSTRPSKRSCSDWSPAAPGMSPAGSASDQRPRCADDATSGSSAACSGTWSKKLSLAMTALCADLGLGDVVVAKRRRHGHGRVKVSVPLGMRWPVERTNSWLSNFGLLRRNTDRHLHHRLAQFALAVVLIITVKLVKWADRWSPPQP